MATDLTSEDPISWTYSRLFFLLEDHKPFVSLFKPGNIIRFDSDRITPRKPSHSTSDLPEVTLEPSSVVPIHATSSTTEIDLGFQLMLKTDDWRVELVGKVTWHAIIAMFLWKKKMNQPQDYRITNLWIPQGQVGQAQFLTSGDKRQVLEGWSTMFQVNAKLIFNTKDILP